MRYDADFDQVLGYDDMVFPLAGKPAVADALVGLNAALMPTGKAVTLKALARLKISTKARGQDGMDAKLQRAVYAEELSGYPADVVDEACRKWARRETWWPSVAEIVAECDYLVRWRRVTRDALARTQEAPSRVA